MATDWHHEQLLTAIKSSASDRRFLHQLFELLLTDKEYDGLAVRLEILRSLLLSHESHRTIAERLHVSVATVTRMANILKADPTRAEKLIARMSTKR